MRKKTIQKHMFLVLLAALSIAQAVSFTACGKKNKDASSEDVQQKDGYVYESTFQDLGETKASYIDNSCVVDSTIYLYGEHYTYNEKTGENKSKYYLMSCGLDDKELVTQEIDTSGFEKEEYIQKFFADDKGTLHLLVQQSKKNKRYWYIYDLSKDGKISNKIKLKFKDKQLKSDEFYPSNAVYAGDTLYIPAEGKITACKMDGTVGKTYDLSPDFGWIDSIFAGLDSQIYILAYKDDKYMFFPLDTETGKLGEGMDFGNYQPDHVNKTQPGEDSTIYFVCENNLYQYDLSAGRAELVFNLINAGIDPNNLTTYIAADGGGFKMVSFSWSAEDKGATIELASIKKVKESEAKHKKVLTLAIAYFGENVKQKLLKYNKASENSRIELKDYSTYEDPGKQLNLDIISGKVPDIIDMANLPANVYIKKGIVADLYPFMEKDEEVSKDKFIDSIIHTVERDGKLYFMPSAVTINALVGSKKEFGDATTWTVGEMINQYEKLPEDSKFMSYMSREWFIQNIMSYQLDDYIDWDSGETHFNSEDFIKLIEFSKNFQERDDINYNKSDFSEAKLAQKGKLLLYNMNLYDCNEIQMYEKLFKKQDGYTILNYPNSTGSDKLTISCSGGGALAITDQCGDKDTAWQFVREFLTYDYQRKDFYSSGIPTRKDALEITLEHAMATKSYTDKDGEEIDPYQRRYSRYSWGNYEIDLGPINEKEAQAVRDLIARAGTMYSYNSVTTDITEIIKEELGAFYTGDKTAKKTADIIQSRVKIYVSENL